MKLRLFLTGVFLLVVAALCSCSSPTSKYIDYRMKPDKVKIEGEHELSLKGLGSEVKIYFDEYAVPHIIAKDEKSLAYAVGYLHARDRRFQMETMRLLAAGKMRELIGDEDESGVMTNLEIFSRMIGLQEAGKHILETASKEDVVFMESYAAGANEATLKEPIPLEFRLLDYTPEPWTAMDSATITALVSFGLNKNWEMELGRLELIMHQLRTGGSIDRAMQIWKPRVDLPPHLIGEKPEVDPFADIPAVPPELVEYLKEYVRQYPDAGQEEKKADAHTQHSPLENFFKSGSASNNWAVSGKWTGTGKGGFSMDPHMPHTLPPLGYLMHVKCEQCQGGGYDVIGATFMGLPAMAFGTNGHTAWGPTSNWGDVLDLYVEKPVPGKPGYYYSKGQELPFTVRTEVFRIKNKDGSYREETLKGRATIHGVILNDFVHRLPENFPLVALKKGVAQGQAISALRNLYRSKSVTEARLALNSFDSMVGHWSLADADGNIGYCGPMPMPRRTKHLGTLPVPGWIDTYEWPEYVPIDQLPYIENPPEGFLGTANNQVVQPESTGYPINFEGNVAHRVKRIYEVLGKGNDGRPVVDQLGTLQLDAIDVGWRDVRPLYTQALTPLMKDSDDIVAEAAQALLSWDGNSTPEAVGPSIFQALNAHIAKRTLEDESSEATMHFFLTYFNAEPMLFGIFGDPENPAWDDRTTKEKETAVEVIREQFKIAVAAMAADHGKKVSKWTWEKVAPFIVHHPFGSEKSLSKFLNRGPFPTRGSVDTLFKNQFMRVEMTRFPVKYGPVLRVMIDFNDLPGSKMCVPGGQSGRPTSKHYDDQMEMFLTGDGISMEMDFDKIKEKSVGSLVLKPLN